MHHSTIIVVITCLAAVANAGYYGSAPSAYAPAPAAYGAPLLKTLNPIIPIVKLVENSDNYGNYNLETVSADGTVMSENGNQKPGLDGQMGAAKTGSYSWTSPDGQKFTVNYVADEFGFRATGAHLPKSVPMPAELAAAYAKAGSAPAYSYGNSYGSYYSGEPMIAISSAPAAFSGPAPPAPPPAFSAPQAPLKTFVQTSQFLIDSDQHKTIVKIGA